MSSCVGCRFMYRRIKRAIYPPGTTPLSWRIHGIIFLTLISSAMTITMLFPFLPHMVKGFGYSDEETGYYVGIIASVLFLGRMFGSYWWGWLSDKYGRKPILLASLICLAVTMLAFGFTFSLPWAIATRFLVGFSNGIVGNCKALLTEASDNTNQALGMAVLSAAWSAGMVIGPGFGGYLAEPATQFPASFAKGSFLDKFAYLLPCVVNTALILFALVMLQIFLPTRFGNRSEVTLNDLSLTFSQNVDVTMEEMSGSQNEIRFSNGCLSVSKNIKNEPVEYNSNSSLVETVQSEQTNQYDSRNENPSSDVLNIREEDREVYDDDLNNLENRLSRSSSMSSPIARVISDGDCARLLDNCDDTEHDAAVSERDQNICCRCCRVRCHNLKDITVWKLLRNGDVRITVANYCLFSFVVIGFDELFNIWAATEPRLGGLGFSSGQIGTTLLISGVLMMFPQIFLFQRSEKRFGVLKTFQGWTILFMFLTVIASCLGPIYDRPVVLWPMLTGMLFIIKVAVACCFCAVSILINNSVTNDQLGSVNGLAMTLTSLLRACSPVVSGSIYAWSITTGIKIGFPFDEHLAFLSLGLILLCVSILSTCISERMNRQRETQGPDANRGNRQSL